MADIVSLHNQNIINFSNIIDDALQGNDNGIKAATNGALVQATKREEYLVRGYKWVVNQFASQLGVQNAQLRLQGAVKFQTLTFNGSGINLNKDFLHAISVMKSGSTNKYVWRSPTVITSQKDEISNNVYTIMGGKIYVYEKTAGSFALLSTGTGLLYYLKAERIDATTGVIGSPNSLVNSEDITIDGKVHDACVYYAASLFAKDKGDADWLNKSKLFEENAVNILKAAL